MNDAVLQDFQEALILVDGDHTAAAQLTLASALHENHPQTQERPLTVPEVAKQFRVTPGKVLHWIHSGELPAVNVASAGSRKPRYRVSADGLATFNTRRAAVTSTSGLPQRTTRRAIPFPKTRHAQS